MRYRSNADDRFAVDVVRNAPPHDHAVDVYADDFAIIRELIRFVEDGLALGETVVVVANRPHRASLAAWRDRSSIGRRHRISAADRRGGNTPEIPGGGQPDPVLFEATIGRDLRSCYTQRPNAPGVRRDGGASVGGWQFCGRSRPRVSVERHGIESAVLSVCAYPAVSLDEASIRAVNAMCDRHSDLSLLGHLTKFAQRNYEQHRRTPSGLASDPDRCVGGASDRGTHARRLGALAPHPELRDHHLGVGRQRRAAR